MNVSIVIPAYNASETISKALESLLAQTYSHWEAIIIDDGSSDNTQAIVENFKKQDTRFYLTNQSHLGGSAARNKGVKLAHYDWLLFLDADDWILPRHLELMTDTLRSNPDLDAVHCG
ncbi:MAG: glycosyltransferase family 2 protein, partial [Anaerolineae bacterium]|nr:glycosyltransferase family 2 protein [Anaerolineae bacterium]